MQCVATYGLIIAQAINNFHNSLQDGAGSVMANNVFKVSNNAFYNEVGQSLYNAITHQSGRFKAQYNIMKYQIKHNTCVIYNTPQFLFPPRNKPANFVAILNVEVKHIGAKFFNEVRIGKRLRRCLTSHEQC